MMIITLKDLCIYFSSPEDGRGRDIAHRRGEEERERERETQRDATWRVQAVYIARHIYVRRLDRGNTVYPYCMYLRGGWNLPLSREPAMEQWEDEDQS